MRLAKSRTGAAVPFVAAIDPAALSAALASSSSATILASDQLPVEEVLLAAPAIADVSVLVVLDAAVVSAALLSFLPHAASASTASPRKVTLVIALLVMLLFPPIGSRNSRLRCGAFHLRWRLRQEAYAVACFR